MDVDEGVAVEVDVLVALAVGVDVEVTLTVPVTEAVIVEFEVAVVVPVLLDVAVGVTVGSRMEMRTSVTASATAWEPTPRTAMVKRCTPERANTRSALIQTVCESASKLDGATLKTVDELPESTSVAYAAPPALAAGAAESTSQLNDHVVPACAVTSATHVVNTPLLGDSR